MILRKCIKGPTKVLTDVSRFLRVYDPDLQFFPFQIEDNIDSWYFILVFECKDVPCFFWDAMLKMYGHLELEIF